MTRPETGCSRTVIACASGCADPACDLSAAHLTGNFPACLGSVTAGAYRAGYARGYTTAAFGTPDGAGVALTISVIVCAHNEAAFLAACLHSLLAQTRPPDDILVINNASTDETRAVALQVPGVRVVDEPRKGLPRARETGRLEAAGTI